MPPSTRPTHRWIVSAGFDLSLVWGPVALALGSLAVLVPLEVGRDSLWAYLFFYVCVDVAHVWGTLYLTWLDRAAFGRRRWLYALSAPACVAIGFALHLASPVAFWTALSYFAVWHFAKQQYGFIAIYKKLGGERDRFDDRLDRLALWTGTFGPILMWHATPGASFSWLGAEEVFLASLPSAALPWLYGAWGLVGAAWTARQLWRWARGGGWNPGKLSWMAATWGCWLVGVRLTDQLFVGVAFLSLLHGIPYMGLVWRRCNVRWQDRPAEAGSRLVRWVSQRRHVLAFYLTLVLLALVEEALWDGVVWGRYLAPLTGVEAPELSAWALSLWVAVLSAPQAVHYVLDGVLWKMNAKNPDLGPALLGRPAAASSQSSAASAGQASPVEA